MKHMLAAALALLPACATADQVRDDLFLAVFAHELGHAAIREFDLPVTASEEAMADAFAVVALDRALPADAARIIAHRAAAHLGDGDTEGMFSEYPDDARRAGADLCLALALDPDRQEAFAPFGLSGDAASACLDFGTEIGRGWRRLIAPYQMPDTARVTEIGLSVDPDFDPGAMPGDAAMATARALMAGLDWHSRVRLSLVQCDGSAGWSRANRQITICDSYLLRLVQDAANGAPQR